MTAPYKIVGILNLTPDSFSDGGSFYPAEKALEQAGRLRAQGAVIIELGGDSTRPGSVCTGWQEEWRRIEPVLKGLADGVVVSVDTHHASTAERALDSGARMINDISAGQDPRMFELVAQHAAQIVLMYSRLAAPHVFADEAPGDIIALASDFLLNKVELALAAGIKRENIILDPGMGAFISASPERSFELLTRFSELQSLGFPLMLGISRKGFLKRDGENSPVERDEDSALWSRKVLKSLPPSQLVYLRVHNPVQEIKQAKISYAT